MQYMNPDVGVNHLIGTHEGCLTFDQQGLELFLLGSQLLLFDLQTVLSLIEFSHFSLGGFVSGGQLHPGARDWSVSEWL